MLFKPTFSVTDRLLETQPQLIEAEMQDIEHTRLNRAMHMHDDRVEIRLIRRGNGIHIIDGRTYATQAGDILIFHPYVLHDECADQMAGLEILGCSIGNIRIKNRKPNHILPDDCSPVIRGGWCTQEAEALLSMIYEGQMKTPKVTQEMQDHLISTLVLLLYQAGTLNRELYQGKVYEVSRAIQDYIDHHYLEEIVISDIAQHLHMGESYLSHTFKKATGYSILQYVIRRRIGEAQSWLLMSKLLITDIATKVGYNSVSHFHNAFRKAVGMTPQQYRTYWRHQ